MEYRKYPKTMGFLEELQLMIDINRRNKKMWKPEKGQTENEENSLKEIAIFATHASR